MKATANQELRWNKARARIIRLMAKHPKIADIPLTTDNEKQYTSEYQKDYYERRRNDGLKNGNKQPKRN